MWPYQYLDHVQLSHPQHTVCAKELHNYAFGRPKFDVLQKKEFRHMAVRSWVKAAAESSQLPSTHQVLEQGFELRPIQKQLSSARVAYSVLVAVSHCTHISNLKVMKTRGSEVGYS